jgi:3-dehydroquinate synthase
MPVERTLRVALAERSYNILIGHGLLHEAGTLIKPFLKRDFVAIVTDTNVAKNHLANLETALKGLQKLSSASRIM